MRSRLPTISARAARGDHHARSGGRRTTVRPVVSRRSRLELGGDIGELDLPTDHLADRSGPGEVQDAIPDVDTLRGGQEVHAKRTSRTRRVGVCEADPYQIEVLVDAGLDWQRALLRFDTRSEPDDEVAALNAMALNVSVVTAPPAVSNATSRRSSCDVGRL